MTFLRCLLVLSLAAAAGAQKIETAQVVSRTPQGSVKLPAELDPWEQVALHARVTGFVESIEVDRGSVVKKGDLLARLSAPEMKSQRIEAEAKVLGVAAQRAEASAKRVATESLLGRLKQAAKTPGAVAENDVVQAAQALDAAQAQCDALERAEAAAKSQVDTLKELEAYLELRAPFAGVVTARHVHPGALASPTSEPLLELEQVGRLRLTVAVPEANVAGISTGAHVEFSVPAQPGKKFTAVIARSARSLDARTRTMAVEADVANAAGALAPGMYAEVVWPVKRGAPGLFVPATAVVTTTEKVFVIRVRQGRRGVDSGDEGRKGRRLGRSAGQIERWRRRGETRLGRDPRRAENRILKLIRAAGRGWREQTRHSRLHGAKPAPLLHVTNCIQAIVCLQCFRPEGKKHVRLARIQLCTETTS
jgi:membrane fusion protein (multidrug efflux system)